jgi:uncharacterized damage-inducible protein DinB
MAIKDALLHEFDHEMGTTRRLLDRAPEAQLGWKPHERSMTLGGLTAHLANIPTWVNAIFAGPVMNLADIPEDARPTPVTSRAELLERFDKNVAAARQRLAAATDPEMLATWTLKQGDHEVFTLPRVAALRSFIMNHSIHHRGQFSVYLRLNDVPLPSIYGPTADES